MQVFLQLVANGLVAGGGYALAALGLTLVFGILDIINMAHGAFYMLGAYVALSATQAAGLGFLPALFVSMAVVAAVAVVTDKVVFKPVRFLGHLPAIIASMGLTLIIEEAVRLLWSADPRYLPAPYASRVLNLGGILLNYQRLLVLVIGVVLVAALHWLIHRTWIGLQMRALAQNYIAARLMGMRVENVSAATFAIGGAITAAAGVLISPIFVVNPAMGGLVGLKSFAVVIFGGVGSIPGTIIAGLLLGVAESLTAGYIAAGFETLVAFVLLIIALVFRPSGLLGKSL